MAMTQQPTRRDLDLIPLQLRDEDSSFGMFKAPKAPILYTFPSNTSMSFVQSSSIRVNAFSSSSALDFDFNICSFAYS